MAFSEAGWKTSYYLPTGYLLDLVKNNNLNGLNSMANKIAKLTVKSKVSAISFDDKLYPFVKKYIEPKISKNIIYHTWWGPELFDNNFQNKLINKPFYSDSRLKTILVSFYSEFNL